MIDIVTADTAIDPLEDLFAFDMIASGAVESRRLGDEAEDDGGKTDESPHGVDGVSPFSNWELRDDLKGNGSSERTDGPLQCQYIDICHYDR